ncbi:protein adenylyltransferase Fic [Chromohalobacter sarecensis]|uniref:Protein adenylyltransferase n=1 Tax=Chromohalobacter sarecensis TaxID=245294 RepID=A0ABV9CZG6_9GAMM|nr:Fic family protein [Chromohalobacter sarecensis]MCK0714931.1 Fic family protein [Chromohalobacter sarecensis]
MPWQPATPFNAIPPLPPEHGHIETTAILKACIEARAALAELKQAGELLPDQGLLINLLPMLEARDSSEIENIVTTTDRLFQFAEEGTLADPATKEALRYRTALYEGFRGIQSRPLTVGTAETICSTLKGVEMSIRKVPGTTLSNQLTGEVIYTPPVGEPLLRDLLGNWEQFLHAEDDLDPLVRMAVAHYQFEAIHPFLDGNGRTGRILNILFLIERNLLTLPSLYLSRYIVRHKADYYRLLLAVSARDDWEPWILFMLAAVEQTARWTTDKITAIRRLMGETRERIQQALPKLYSHELLHLIFEQPYCRIGNLVERDIAKRQTASVYLKQLSGIGVLEARQAGKEKLFINAPLMALMRDDG